MNPFRSIRNLAVLSMAILLPAGLMAIHPQPQPDAPSIPGKNTPVALDAAHAAALLVDAIIQIESQGNPLRVGRHGERGLMQIKAETWRDMTTRLFGQPLPFDQAFDPALNRRVGTAYLAFLQETLLPRQAEWQADERSLLLAAYNAGPGRLFRSKFNLARLPSQTRDYVERASTLHDFFLGDLAAFLPRPPTASL